MQMTREFCWQTPKRRVAREAVRLSFEKVSRGISCHYNPFCAVPIGPGTHVCQWHTETSVRQSPCWCSFQKSILIDQRLRSSLNYNPKKQESLTGCFKPLPASNLKELEGWWRAMGLEVIKTGDVFSEKDMLCSSFVVTSSPMEITHRWKFSVAKWSFSQEESRPLVAQPITLFHLYVRYPRYFLTCV